MSITQRELGHQQGANARVLAYLLQRENDSYVLTAHENGQRAKTLELLRMVVTQQPEIRVLLDVGAQILDVSNLDLAQEWLTLSVPRTVGASCHAPGKLTDEGAAHGSLGQRAIRQ